MGTDRRARVRTWLLQVVLPVLALAAGAMWLGSTEADAALLDPFFDHADHDFPLHSHWFFDSGMHEGGKFLVIAIAAVMTVLAVRGAIQRKPRAAWGQWLYPVVCLLLTVAIAGQWKHMAHQGVPSDLLRFGGTHARLDERTPVIFGLHLGSPAAHAASAFAWISLYFVAVSLSVARPWVWIVPGAALGLLFALTQHVRGAHVISHNLWSIAIAWSVAAGVASVFRRLGLLAYHDPVVASVRTTSTGRPASLRRGWQNLGVEPWLVGACGFLGGTAFFAVDALFDQSEGRSESQFSPFEFSEWVLMGPGIGLMMFLVADRIRLMRERAARRVLAEHEDRLRLLGRMAASVAHEVRNPLHTLRLIVDEQKLDVPGLAEHPLQPELQACMERINRAVDLVYRLARPVAGEEGQADIVGAVRASLEDFERSLPVPPVRLLERWPERAEVNATPTGLRIVVDNLLRNAIEAAGLNARITLDLAAEDEDWVLRLKNPGRLAVHTGNGVLESHKPDGLGLGMAISRQIVAGAGGSLDLREEDGLVCCTLRWPTASKHVE